MIDLVKTSPFIKKLSNKKLLEERRLMKTGKYYNTGISGRGTHTQQLEAEIKRRKEAGTMKRSANYKKKQSGLGFIL